MRSGGDHMNKVEKSENNGSFTIDSSKDACDLSTQLNALYRPLEMKAYLLVQGLFHRIFAPQLTYCSHHYRRETDGTCRRNCYPIPLITVNGYCEIEVDFYQILVSTKLQTSSAVNYPYDRLSKYVFEVYDADDYETAYYLPGMTFDGLKETLRKCKTKEVGFSFIFDHSLDGNTVYEFAKLLRREGFCC